MTFMNRQTISSIAHGEHPIGAPLQDASVERLLGRALVRGDERVLDLGCGAAEWLARAAAGRPGVTGDGVDLSEPALARGQERLDAAGLGERVTLHRRDAMTFRDPEPYDAVLCIGSTYAFGGLMPTLDACGRHLARKGRVLVGEAFWEREPNARTLAAGFEKDDYTDLAGTVARVTEAGWTPVYAHVSTRAEWDDYEWSWTGTLSAWALDHPSHRGANEALAEAESHREAWLEGYRGALGFVTFVLRWD
ncbi:SAM-dependent methyltransferase [Streptomyces sp. NPDC050418]|uniref:SAM-dependent methyltransferase n=1 Tax=Streptomyces sp. NPDC050418 TaxID=3365612 RepID=UPI0037BBCB0B